MIVVTVGTHEQQFDRLMRAVVALGDSEPMLVQYGTCTITSGPGEWVDFLSFDELAERAAGARAFICHAGVGSIVLARRCGHRPIIMARRPDLGEHVDEHQLELSRRLHQAGLVTVVEDELELAAAVRNPDAIPAAGTTPTALYGPSALSADVRGILEGLGAARRLPVAA
jgi:UDP-N-acetylglucosamine transferase subunit ALG13